MSIQLRDKSGFEQDWLKDATEIDWLIDGNPKRAGFKAHARFENYFGAINVKEYLELGGTRADLRYDWEHKFLDLSEFSNAEIKVTSKTNEVDEVDEVAQKLMALDAADEAREAEETENAKNAEDIDVELEAMLKADAEMIEKENIAAQESDNNNDQDELEILS